MDSIGDIIYLVLIVVFGIIGTIGNKNKKKSTKGENESTIPDISKTWEEIERKFSNFGKEEGTATTDNLERTSKMKTPALKRDEILSYETAEDMSKLRMKSRIKESIFKTYKPSKPLGVEVTDETYTDDAPCYYSIQHQDDARKAFVYSEIFNRKYN